MLLIGWRKFATWHDQSEALLDLGSNTSFKHVISVEFLRIFLRRHFKGKPVVVSRNIGCFLRLVLGTNKIFCHPLISIKDPSHNPLSSISAQSERGWDLAQDSCIMQVIVLNYGRFATKSSRCNHLFVLNSLKQFRMNYKWVITIQVSETTLQLCSELTSLCSEATCSERTILHYVLPPQASGWCFFVAIRQRSIRFFSNFLVRPEQ